MVELAQDIDLFLDYELFVIDIMYFFEGINHFSLNILNKYNLSKASTSDFFNLFVIFH